MLNLFDVHGCNSVVLCRLNMTPRNDVFRVRFCATHPSLQGSQTRRLGIGRQVRQPESRLHMHDEADRVSVLDLRHSHPINVPLRAYVALFLLR